MAKTLSSASFIASQSGSRDVPVKPVFIQDSEPFHWRILPCKINLLTSVKRLSGHVSSDVTAVRNNVGGIPDMFLRNEMAITMNT